MIFPQALKERLARRQCVAFIGAGFSMPCGMPNWHNLLTMLLEDAETFLSSPENEKTLTYCEKAIIEGQYSLAASIFRETLPINDLEEAIRNKFATEVFKKSSDETQARMNERMKNLISTPWAGILTTNYDELIELAIGQYNTRENIKAYGNDSTLGSILCSPFHTGFFFVKLHGSITGGNYVLGTEEYDRTYINTPQVTSFLIALMLRYHIIFIGCSLEDEILRIRRKLCFDFSGRIPTAYALIPHTTSNFARKTWLRTYAQIEPLFYEAELEGHPSHYEVDCFLEKAAQCTDKITDKSKDDNITSEWRKLSLEQKVTNIGLINKELLQIILKASEDHSISHQKIINLSLLNDVNINKMILNISPEERIYRVLFLETIGLIKTKKSPDDSLSYIVPQEVFNILNSSKETDG